MRRSVREALVGFTLLAGLASGLGLWMWLKGLTLSRNTWTMSASFADAAGLADRSPVYFRGVMVGSVRHIRVSDQAVVAQLEITDPTLRLPRPVVARVASASLLGGDAMVSLLSSGQPLPSPSPSPRDRRCNDQRMVCDKGTVAGVSAASLDSVTETVQRLLNEAERQKLVPQIVASTRSFEKTAREAERLSKDSQVLIQDAQVLINRITPLVGKADPILTNLNAASSDAAQASKHVKQFTAALDNPKTVADLQATLANAKLLTARWEEVGADVRKLSGDPEFIKGIRNVSVGLGQFFQELYPGQTDAARSREERQKARQQEASQRNREEEERLAPRSR